MATDMDFDAQDTAEAFDEDNLMLDGDGVHRDDRLTFEELPEVLDVTTAAGDGDDDTALIAEELDDDEVIALAEDADSADIEDDDLEGRMPEAFEEDDSVQGEDVDTASPSGD